MSTSPDRASWRILAFGKHPEIAVSVQATLRSLGLQAKVIALTDDAAGDARLIEELRAAEYDGVSIGGFINGQDPVVFPASPETTAWFNPNPAASRPVPLRGLPYGQFGFRPPLRSGSIDCSISFTSTRHARPRSSSRADPTSSPPRSSACSAAGRSEIHSAQWRRRSSPTNASG